MDSITPEALEAAGFSDCTGLFLLALSGLCNLFIEQNSQGDWIALLHETSMRGALVTLPRTFTTMTEIHELIRVLKGEKA